MIQIKGLEALQCELLKREEAFTQGLQMEIEQLAEEAVVYSKNNKGYRDITANLKNSISFVLYKDGEEVIKVVGELPDPDKAEGGQAGVERALEEYAQSGVISPHGFSLIVVACMSYGKNVEDKGYNVLHLTRYFLRDEMEKILERVLERINKG